MKLGSIHLFSKKIRHANSVRREVFAPTREWFLVLSVGVLLLVAGIFYAVFVYWSATKDVATSDVAPSTVDAIYKPQKVRAVIESYTAKARRFEELRATQASSGVVQPSTQIPVAAIATTTLSTPSAMSTAPEVAPVAEVGGIQVE